MIFIYYLLKTKETKHIDYMLVLRFIVLQ
jgi:hypothetical protein